MCYTTQGVEGVLSEYEPADPTRVRLPQTVVSDPTTRSVLADQGFTVSPTSPGGYTPLAGNVSASLPFVSRGLIGAMGSGTGRQSRIDRISPMAHMISTPFASKDQSYRQVR